MGSQVVFSLVLPVRTWEVGDRAYGSRARSTAGIVNRIFFVDKAF